MIWRAITFVFFVIFALPVIFVVGILLGAWADAHGGL